MNCMNECFCSIGKSVLRCRTLLAFITKVSNVIKKFQGFLYYAVLRYKEQETRMACKKHHKKEHCFFGSRILLTILPGEKLNLCFNYS